MSIVEEGALAFSLTPESIRLERTTEGQIVVMAIR